LKNICIVTNEIFGPHKNGGIGTSQTFLALLLAANFYAVDIVYTGKIDHRDREFWVNWYAIHGVNFIELTQSGRLISPGCLQKSHELYDYLKGRVYNAIVFQDWGGDGYATACAKAVGEFQSTVIITWLHSPSVWLRYANREYVESIDDLYQLEMERIAVEQSDFVLSPSRYLLGWLSERGWQLKLKEKHLPLYIPNISLDEEGRTPFSLMLPGPNAKDRSRKLNHGGHVVFFGRLEIRKGVEQFALALRKLAAEPRIRRVTLLGKAASYSYADVLALIGSAPTARKMEHLGDLNASAAIEWLIKEDPLVVIPSLVDNSPCVVYECLNNNLNFITTNSGGMSELIDPDSWASHVCPPRGSDIAELIRKNLGLTRARATPPRPVTDAEQSGRAILDFFESVVPENKVISCAVSAPAKGQDVCVVLTHFERPHLLDGALAALDNQTVAGFKVILVDDHSLSEGAIQKLAQVGNRKYHFDLSVVKKERNDYLGAARNTGLAMVDTPYVIFLDDDNLPMPWMVERFLFAINFSGADIVTSMMVGFTDIGSVRLQEIERHRHWAFVPGSLAIGCVRNAFGDATSIYRSEAVRDLGGFHQQYGVTHEDWELHLKAAIHGMRHEYIPAVTYWYRGSPNSMIRTTNQYLNDQRQISTWSALVPNSAKVVVEFLVGVEVKARRLEAEIAQLRATVGDLISRAEREETAARSHLRRIASVLRGGAPGKVPKSLRRLIEFGSGPWS
jgi:O-antigen biosynthesis protein